MELITKMKSFRKIYAIALVSGLSLFPPMALAQSILTPNNPSYITQTKFNYVHVKNTLVVDGATTLTGAVTQKGSTTFTADPIAPGYVLTGTNFNATIAATAGLGQATTYTIPDPGASTDTFATLAAANAFTGNNTFTGTSTFPTGGIILKGTSFNGTLKEVAALGQATTYTIPDTGTATATLIATSGNANGQVAKSQRFIISPTTLGTSATTNYTFCPGRACTIINITAYALTKPSGTSDVTTQVFKNSTSTNAVCSSYDLNALTNATGAPITITGNSTLTATDAFVIQTITGSSIGGAANVSVAVEVLLTDY